MHAVGSPRAWTIASRPAPQPGPAVPNARGERASLRLYGRFGLPGGGLISFGGYGYGALVNPLRIGQHTIDFHPEGEGAPPDTHAVITVG